MRRLRTAILLAICTTLTAQFATVSTQDAGRKEFRISVQRFKFTPDVLEVREGDAVWIEVRSSDVTHGFKIKAFGVDKEIPKGGEPVVIEFVAHRGGTFEVECSEYCGKGHKTMKATLVVSPKADKHEGGQP